MRQSTRLKSICCGILIQLFLLCIAGSLGFSQTNLQSGDAYARRRGNEWTIGTARAERKIRFVDGKLVLASLRNKVSGREYQDGTPPNEIRFLANGQDVSASAWHWELRGDHATRGSQGEVQL